MGSTARGGGKLNENLMVEWLCFFFNPMKMKRRALMEISKLLHLD